MYPQASAVFYGYERERILIINPVRGVGQTDTPTIKIH